MQFVRSSDYRFEERKIGLLVVLENREQKALDEGRIVRRSMAEETTEGYASDPEMHGVMPMQAEFGDLIPPSDVQSLNDQLEHGTYDGGHVVSTILDRTSAVMSQHGYEVEVIPVPSGDFNLSESATIAREKGCDLLAVEMIALAQSWNVAKRYRAAGSSTLSSSLRWQQQIGGLVLLGLTVFDLDTEEIVWEHDRREIDASQIGPLLGESYDPRIARARFARRPSEYQTWLYKQSAVRAIYMLFAANDPRFHSLPLSTDSLNRIHLNQRYQPGDYVFARPSEDSDIWHRAEVTTDEGGAIVQVRWMQSMWEPHAVSTDIPRISTVPAETGWSPIVWVRRRDALVYSPERFVRYDEAGGYVYTSRAGDIQQKTFLVGRVGIIPTWQVDQSR